VSAESKISLEYYVSESHIRVTAYVEGTPFEYSCTVGLSTSKDLESSWVGDEMASRAREGLLYELNSAVGELSSMGLCVPTDNDADGSERSVKAEIGDF